jgi:hypothetical protein
MNSTVVILDKMYVAATVLRESYQIQINGHDVVVSGTYNLKSNSYWPTTINGEVASVWAEQHQIDSTELLKQLSLAYEERE